MNFSPSQAAAVDRILEWQKAPRADLVLAGLGGTGKTSILKHVAGGGKCLAMAPTGRAAQILRRKGVVAETIHSVIYDFAGHYIDEDTKRERLAWRDKGFVDRPTFWVIDEASMVSDSVYRDLKAHGVPILFVGDHGQLPPVGGDPGIMRNPDIILEEIHRQAAGSEILDVAYEARQGFAPVVGERGSVSVRRAPSIQEAVTGWLESVDQVACAYNATRIKINSEFRRQLGRTKALEVGDRIICLYNDRSRGVYNGTMMAVDAILETYGNGWLATVTDDGGAKRTLPLWSGALGGKEYNQVQRPTDRVVVDYAFAITVHKSQGGQWPRFAVVDQPCRAWDHSRWRYTAFSRAETRLEVYV